MTRAVDPNSDYRPLPRGFLPLMAAWGLSPALLLVTCVLLTELGGAGSPARVVGAILGQVSLLATPVILACGALELRGRSRRLLRLSAGFLALLLAAANLALALGAFALIEVAL